MLSIVRTIMRTCRTHASASRGARISLDGAHIFGQRGGARFLPHYWLSPNSLLGCSSNRPVPIVSKALQSRRPRQVQPCYRINRTIGANHSSRIPTVCRRRRVQQLCANMSSYSDRSADPARHHYIFDEAIDEDTGVMPVLGDPARLERQRLKRAELVRVHDHYQDYNNHLSLLLQKEPIEAKRSPIQLETKLPKKKEIIGLKLDRTRELIEDKEREMRAMRLRK